MSEFREAIRGLPWPLLVPWVALLALFIIAMFVRRRAGMSEFRAALRGVPWYLLFGFVVMLALFIVADLVGNAAAFLMLIPGLAAGLAAGGGWKRGFLSGVIGAVTIGIFGLVFRGGFFLFFVPLVLASAASGAAGGEIRARRGRR